MGHFISWTHIDPNTPDELILFLSDKEIETKEGQQLIIDTGRGSDILGHGALCSYYGLNGNRFPHLEKTDLYSADGFPQKIIDAVVNGKMNNIMRYVIPEQLFQMLTPECQIIKQEQKEQAVKPTDYESEEFLPGTPCRTREQVIAKLDYIKKNESTFLHGAGVYCTYSHKRKTGNILAHFRWTDTKDGYDYWLEVSRSMLVNTYNGIESPEQENTIRKTYQNFLKLWKDNDNRLDCWKRKEEQPEAPKTKRKRTTKQKQTA